MSTDEKPPTDDRPSIAELQGLESGPTTDPEYAAIRKTTLALLEIAATALALRGQEVTAAKARHVLYARIQKNREPTDEQYAASDVEDRKLKACRDAYDAALAKVRP